ncbi:Uu.00g095870.m01.CDS01 [Anthostomella pinea]|uniref:Uu.00g095870.m01.CDS01 n=1 Tax=Anthostomella pinea TaxID=933095 RepID=A0AAI8V728_9PEZI|nr:Uu.00g095870.m01.CDS01 [Anthostomella pinea]
MDFMPEVTLNDASDSIQEGHRAKDFQWSPSATQKAKLRYRQALALRLQRKSESAGRALALVDEALELLPGDRGITRERQTILMWLSQLS